MASVRFSRSLHRAPRDGRLLVVLVPTGNADEPLSHEIVWYDAALKRWEGDYRYDDQPRNWAENDPIAWVDLLPAAPRSWREKFASFRSKRARRSTAKPVRQHRLAA